MDPMYCSRSPLYDHINRVRKENFEVKITSRLKSELSTRIDEKVRGGWLLIVEGKSIDGAGYTVYYAVLRKPNAPTTTFD